MGARARLGGRLTAEDRRLLEKLVGELGSRLLTYIRRVYADRDEAEDIVAEAFCRAARNMAALRASRRPDLYLLTIARNLCRDRFRQRRPDCTGHDGLVQHPRHAQPDDKLAQDEETRALRQAVAALPDDLREVVVLRLSTGLTFEQIAELLHIPLGTALSRMHAALRQLRQRLGPTHEH